MKLKNKHIYALSEIADKMDFTFPKAPILKGTKEQIDQTRNEYGREIMTNIVKKIHKAQNEINKLLADVNEKTIEEIENMEIKEAIKMFSDLLKQEGVLSFFK